MSRRTKDWDWGVDPSPGRNAYAQEQARLSVLMDIRDELKALNRVFQCANFTSLPEVVRDIRSNTANIKRNTAKRRKKVARK